GRVRPGQAVHDSANLPRPSSWPVGRSAGKPGEGGLVPEADRGAGPILPERPDRLTVRPPLAGSVASRPTSFIATVRPRWASASTTADCFPAGRLPTPSSAPTAHELDPPSLTTSRHMPDRPGRHGTGERHRPRANRAPRPAADLTATRAQAGPLDHGRRPRHST